MIIKSLPIAKYTPSTTQYHDINEWVLSIIFEEYLIILFSISINFTNGICFP